MAFRFFSDVCCVTVLMFGSAVGVVEMARAADQPPATGQGDQLEEIVITAEKREGTLQHAALDIAVVSGAELQNSGIEDFTTLYKVAPSVNVNSGGGGGIGQTVIAIDGIHPYNLTAVTQSPIAVSIDGDYIPRMSGLTGYFYDLQRVEILDGPQGTLYGRNATGGAINMITNKPNAAFGATGEVEFGNYGESRIEGDLNLPVSDVLWLRFAARDYQHQGYFDDKLSDAHQEGGRVSAQLNFSNQSTLLATIDYENSHDHDEGVGIVGVRNLSATENANGTYTVNPAPSIAVPSNAYNNASTVYPYGIGNSTDLARTTGAQLTFTDPLDFATLIAQVGYRKLDAYAVYLQPPNPLVGGPAGSEDFPASSHSYSGEVRLASTASNPLQWITGLYAFAEQAGGNICVQGSFEDPTCDLNSGEYNHSVSYAWYAQGIYTPSIDENKLHFVLGLRYNYDRVTASDYEEAVFFPPGGAIDNVALEHSGQKGTYKVGINFDLTPDNLLYISNSTGYRAFNFQYGTNPYVPAETIKNWNIGSKNEFFDRRLRVNFDAFLDHYFGSERSELTYPPASAPFLPFGAITAFSTGETRYEGANLSVNVVITPDDHLNASVQYINATYLDFVVPAIYKNTLPENSLGIPTGQAAGDFDGTPVGDVTPWAGTASYDHRWDIGPGELTGMIAMNFNSATHMTDAIPGTITDVLQPGYVQGDLSLRYGPRSDIWSVTAWCRNFTDKITWNSAQYSSSTGLVTATLNPPRTFGLTLRAKVGGG